MQGHARVGLYYEVADGSDSLDALREPEALKQALSTHANYKTIPLAAGVEAVVFVPLKPSLFKEGEIHLSGFHLDDKAQEEVSPGAVLLLKRTLFNAKAT